jgi:hypothetical protein
VPAMRGTKIIWVKAKAKGQRAIERTVRKNLRPESSVPLLTFRLWSFAFCFSLRRSACE